MNDAQLETYSKLAKVESPDATARSNADGRTPKNDGTYIARNSWVAYSLVLNKKTKKNKKYLLSLLKKSREYLRVHK